MVSGSPYKAVLQPEEVEGLYEVDINEFTDLLDEKLEKIEAKGIKLNPDRTYTMEYRDIVKSDVAPHSKDYYKKALDMIKRYVDNI